MNQYHIYEKIGKGKYSTVYKGRKKKTISYYAIKSVDKSQKARVLQEVRTMHMLDHKNILKFVAWYETTNHLWLILEYCVGGDLMSLLRQDVRLPESSVHDFGRDLVVALQYLHHNSIIYCDLKPSNILLDENGRLKLGGFGLSRKLADINKTPLLALPSAKHGTPCYMAPELFSEGATHSSASDLWALGCVLYECAMGRPPFLNSSFNQLVQEILSKEPAAIPGASREFANLLSRLLDKNPATRIGWKELVVHPFWQAKLSWLELPQEPALEQFIARHNLSPGNKDPRASMASNTAAQSLRQSVNVTRLSRIALNNMEKEGEGSDYTAAEMRPGDIRIENPDAELDFDEQKDEVPDDEEAPSPAQADDGAVIDQGTPPGETSSRVAALGSMAPQESVQRGATTARGRGGEPPSGAAGLGPSAPPDTQAGAAKQATMAGGATVGLAQRVVPQPLQAAPQPDLDAGPGPDTPGEAGSHVLLPAGDSPSLESLIWHTSDAAVKPIVANRRIERLPDPKFEAKGLQFTPLTLQEMLGAEQKDLETFLTHIYRAIASAAPLKDKVNVLSYFETLCVDTNAANVLINSSLTILFIRMLRNARAPTLRIRLASVMGLLVRHATYIAEELAQTGVIEILTEALKDKNERVRRRVMATLGELLFYIATQQQDAQDGATAQEVSDSWNINSGTVAAVTRLLKPTEDEIAQHYAVKTIENICSQGGDWAAKFASQELAASLVAIYSSTKAENLKATTASTLARLLRHSPALVASVVDKFGIHLFVAGLSDSSSKVQTSAINMLNMALSLPDLSMRAKSALAEERSLIPSLMQLLDHALPLLRAKSIVTLLLLSRLSTKWLLDACKSKLVPTLERLHRDKDEYLAEAIAALRTETARLVPVICTQVSDELAKVSSRKTPPAASPGRASSASKNPLAQFQVVLCLVTSPIFRTAAVNPSLIAALSTYLTAANSPALAATAAAEFKETMMHVIESVCQQIELVLQHYQAMLDTLLPALCAVVRTPAESGDMRFFCLRMVSEASQKLMLDPELYGTLGGITEAGVDTPPQRGFATEAVDALITGHVLPMVPQLLRDDDPMPLYGLKLLGSLLDVNPGYVPAVETLGLAPQFFDFLSLEHSNNNVHNIRLCRQIIAAGSMPVQELVTMQVADRVSAVLEYATQNNVEPFLEPVLELCHAIVQRDQREVEAGNSEGALMAVLLEQSGVFLDLCARPDPASSVAAAVCLLDMVTMYPQQCAPWLMSSDSLAALLVALQGTNGSPVAPQVQMHLLEAVREVLPVPGAVTQQSQELSQLADITRQLLSAPGSPPSLKTLAGEISKALAPYL